MLCMYVYIHECKLMQACRIVQHLVCRVPPCSNMHTHKLAPVYICACTCMHACTCGVLVCVCAYISMWVHGDVGCMCYGNGNGNGNIGKCTCGDGHNVGACLCT